MREERLEMPALDLSEMVRHLEDMALNTISDLGSVTTVEWLVDGEWTAHPSQEQIDHILGLPPIQQGGSS